MPANAAMPANTTMPMFLTSCETECTYENMAESELLCVGVATLLRNEYKSDIIKQYMSELSKFLLFFQLFFNFNFFRYLPRLQEKNTLTLCSDHNLGKGKLKI